MPLLPSQSVICFNPRSHVGSDVFCVVDESLKIKFQSTLPRGERPSVKDDFKVGLRFQSTLPRGERHGFRAGLRVSPGFNPRSHVGSDASYLGETCQQSVSIHAPTWGATTIVKP